MDYSVPPPPEPYGSDVYPVEDAGDGVGYWIYDNYFSYPQEDQWDVYFDDEHAEHDTGEWYGDEWEEPVAQDEYIYDVDEYDDVLMAYQEARKKMNDMRLARGFYLIVAFAPGPPSQAPGLGGRKTRKGKGKGRRPPGPRKGKRSWQVRSRSCPQGRTLLLVKGKR